MRKNKAIRFVDANVDNMRFQPPREGSDLFRQCTHSLREYVKENFPYGTTVEVIRETAEDPFAYRVLVPVKYRTPGDVLLTAHIERYIVPEEDEKSVEDVLLEIYADVEAVQAEHRKNEAKLEAEAMLAEIRAEQEAAGK